MSSDARHWAQAVGRFRSLLVLSMLVAVVACRPVGTGLAVHSPRLEEDLVETFLASDPSFDRGLVHARLREITKGARTATRGARTAQDRVDTLNRFFFQDLGFAVDPGPEGRQNLFLDDVLRRRRGHCTSLVLVYLLIARGAGIPVYAVSAPSHLFARYDDQAERLNIELLERGKELSDEVYRRRYRIVDDSVERGVFLTNLSDDRVVSVVLNNLGVLRSQAGDYARSVALYEEAIGLDMLNAEARYNLAKDQMALGRLDAATAGFTAALELHPNDVNALNNRGICRARLGDLDGAIADFRAALAIEPTNLRIRRNLERATGSVPPS